MNKKEREKELIFIRYFTDVNSFNPYINPVKKELHLYYKRRN